MDDTKNSTLVVIPKNVDFTDRFLVYIAPQGKAFSGLYRFVGGKIKVDENYIETLQRELLEEYNVVISDIELLYKKKNVLGGQVFLCSGIIVGEPIKKEDDVGEPEWRTVDELFSSSLVLNCKTALYCYLSRHQKETLDHLIPLLKKDDEFISFLFDEAKDLHSDLIQRIEWCQSPSVS